MAPNGAIDPLAFTVGCFLAVVHMAKVARDLCTPAWRQGACETCAKFARLLRSRLQRRGVADELTKEVAARLLAWQLREFQSALKALLLARMASVVTSLCKSVLGIPRFHTAAQDAIMFVSYAALLLADWCPWLVNKRSLDVWYAVSMCGLALYMIPPFCARSQLLEAFLLTKLLGAMLSLGRMNLSAVCFWNAVHAACGLWAQSVLGQTLGMNFSWIWPLMLSLLIGRIEVHVESELRKDIEAKLTQDRQSAGDALSAMFYDVVVELDQNLCIAAPAPKLAAFLLRSTPLPLECTPFEDLLQDDVDRARFRDLICPAGPPPASSFVELAHARMRGGYGAVFQVELFGYRFRGPVGRQRYLVGVREAGDLERSGMPMVHAGPQPAATSPFDEHVVVIDPYRANFPILSHTPFFGIHIMPVPEGACLMPAVVKGAKFEAWVQEMVNWHRYGMDEPELRDWAAPGGRPEESFLVTFKPRSRNVPLCTRALCRLKVEDGTSSSSSGSSEVQLRVSVSFSHLVQVRRCQERAHSGSSSSSSSGTPRSRPRMSLGVQQSDQPAIFGLRTSL